MAPSMVTIYNEGNVIAQVRQKDLFKKYQWPAKPEIMQALENFRRQKDSAAKVGS